MPRKPRNLQPGYCYHITIRCNNREFNLAQRQCREVLLCCIKKAIDKYGFKLYALCIMSNHIHYLIEPAQPSDLPKIMHFLNWYAAMCFNRMLNRTGHFWEKRYYSEGFPIEDADRALNTLRYIHANPKAAKMRQGFFLKYQISKKAFEKTVVEQFIQANQAFDRREKLAGFQNPPRPVL